MQKFLEENVDLPLQLWDKVALEKVSSTVIVCVFWSVSVIPFCYGLNAVLNS